MNTQKWVRVLCGSILVSLMLTYQEEGDRAQSKGLADSSKQQVLAGFVMGGFDLNRGWSGASLSGGSYYNQVRTAISANYPGASFDSMSELNQANLSGVDLLFLTSTYANQINITPLSQSEQDSLFAYAVNGGAAFLVVDHENFGGSTSDLANESLIDPFGMDVSGTYQDTTAAQVVTPAGNSVTNGPYGLVKSFLQVFPGGFETPGPYGQVLATNAVGGALVVIPPNAIQPGSGPVVIFSDANSFYDDADSGGFTENEALFLNVIEYFVRHLRGDQPPIVLIPDFLGTSLYNSPLQSGSCELRPDGEVWPGLPASFLDPVAVKAFMDRLTTLLLRPNGIEGANACDAITPGELRWVDSETGRDRYQAFYETFHHNYHPSQSVYLFAYDWRLGVGENSSRLDQWITGSIQQPKVILVGHGLGGLIARQYVADPLRSERTAAVIAVGAPFWGAPKSAYMIRAGAAALNSRPADGVSAVMRDLFRNFLSVTQLLPSQAYMAEVSAGDIIVTLIKSPVLPRPAASWLREAKI